MKKKSNGGFILAETIAVSTVVLGALVLIFTQFVTISKGYNNSFTYNNVDKLYSVSNVRDYILNDGFEELALALESEPYINITNCPTNYIVEYHYCEMLMDTLKVKDVLITKANMEDIKEADLSSFSQGMRNFIKILPGEEEGYRLIAEFDDENYATLLINDKITNLPNVNISANLDFTISKISPESNSIYLTVNRSENSGIDHYKYDYTLTHQYGVSVSNQETFSNTTTDNLIVIADLDEESTYKVRVSAVDKNGKELTKELDPITTQVYYCFTAGTKVLTEYGYKNIEDINIEDKVWTINLDTNESVLNKVTKTIQSSAYELYHITINGEVVSATPKHRFYIQDRGWVRASDLKLGDNAVAESNTYKITKIDYEKLVDPITVYNLEVAEQHNYLVTKNSILVHNAMSQMDSVPVFWYDQNGRLLKNMPELIINTDISDLFPDPPCQNFKGWSPASTVITARTEFRAICE